jgi:diaminohydroxyphosphoribosylaminopyrimidine deaminase/5-amino-6-(5-phosphoribosylamino)uracil reductase
VRAVSGKNPIRIIVDSQLQAPKTATVFTDGLPTIVFNTLRDDQEGAVRFVQLPDCSVENQLKALFGLNITSVFIEGGKFTLQQYIDTNSWDEARVIVGTTRFGSGITAPNIGRVPTKTTTYSTDTIHTFSPS